jgi:two-component system, sensor histidine kinase and response regulator
MEKIKAPGLSEEIKTEKELSSSEKILNLEAENKKLKNKLENMNKSFRLIAHDLINPIGSFAVFSELLAEETKNSAMSKEELTQSLTVLSKGGKDTLKLLEDLLMLSRLQHDGIKPEILELKLTNQIESALDILLPIASQKNIKLNNEVEGGMEVMADSNMLKTVIRNLSSNAIKFTNKGGNIYISSLRKDNQVEIYITDDGVGLKEEQKQNLFETFGVSSQGTNQEKGTGFGLSICKELVEKMGGAIAVESEGEGKGSRFIVTLPAVEK